MTDGPFTESKELIAGYCLIQVKSKEEAIAWVRRAPFDGGTVIERRQVFEPEHFAALDPTGEHMAKEVEFRARAAGVSAATWPAAGRRRPRPGGACNPGRRCSDPAP